MNPSDFLTHFSFGRIAMVVLIIAAAAVAVHWLTRILSRLGARSARARFLVRWIEPLIGILIWFIASLSAIAIVAPNMQAFTAAVGSIALAIGLGAQDLVKNLIGGLIILTDRPYQLGDRVKIGEAYGEIDHIGLRSTKLTTPEDTRVTIPNAQVLTAQVFNANSGVPDCQVVTELVVPISCDPDELLRIGHEAAYTSPFTYLAKPITVLIIDAFEFRPHMRLRIRAYVHDHRYEPEMQSDVTARAKRELLRRGLLASWQIS